METVSSVLGERGMPMLIAHCVLVCVSLTESCGGGNDCLYLLKCAWGSFCDSSAVWCGLVLKVHSRRWESVCANSVSPLGCGSSQPVIVRAHVAVCVGFYCTGCIKRALARRDDAAWFCFTCPKAINSIAVRSLSLCVSVYLCRKTKG